MIVTKLGDVAGFVRGITFKPTDVVPAHTPNSVVYMRTKNVQQDLDESDIYAIPASFVKRAEQYLNEGDLLVSSANSWNLVGKCCWVGKINYLATAGGFISILRAKDGQLDARYLYHWFSSPHTQNLVRNCGRQTTNISNLDVHQCLDLQIPIPPIEEQKRIAAILDKADELRRKRREAIVKLDSLLQSVFLEMFGDPVTNPKGWNVLPLNEACKGKYGIKAGPFGSSLKKEDYASSGYRVYGQEQVIKGDFRYGDYYIDKDKFLDLKSCEVKPGDVLMSLVGTIGRVVVVPEGVEPGIINPRLLKITPQNNLLNPTFLANMLSLPSLQKQLREESHGGTMSILNAGIVKNIRIPLPTFEAQLTFSERVISIVALQEQAKWSQRKENELFASLQRNVILATAY